MPKPPVQRPVSLAMLTRFEGAHTAYDEGIEVVPLSPLQTTFQMPPGVREPRGLRDFMERRLDEPMPSISDTEKAGGGGGDLCGAGSFREPHQLERDDAVVPWSSGYSAATSNRITIAVFGMTGRNAGCGNNEPYDRLWRLHAGGREAPTNVYRGASVHTVRGLVVAAMASTQMKQGTTNGQTWRRAAS
jgi:hypothetical protein